MGVQGLWQVLEPVGKPVDINRLRGKVFAIDVSIWLHQAVKGYRDKDGNPLPNAHLLGVFFRVCKLLNYGIKPVFVFDGGVPVLKRQTMSLRKTRKIEAMDKSEASRRKLLTNYIQQELQRKTRQALPPTLRMAATIEKLSSPSKDKTRSPNKSSAVNDKEIPDDLEMFRDNWSGRTEDDGEKFKRTISEESDSSCDMQYSRDYSENFSSIMSENFDALPLETQHEILFEMQESKKNNSWGKIHQMPQDLQSFSSFQMDRLVKRRTLQKKIQKVQHEMGQRHIHVQNLDDLLKMEYDFDENKSEVIASQEGGFVLVKTKPGTNGEQKPETSSKKTSDDTDCIIIPNNKDNLNDFIDDKDIKQEKVTHEGRQSSENRKESEKEGILLALNMLQQQDKLGNSETFSSNAIHEILSKIQSRLKEKEEEKRNTPKEVITIESDASEDDSDQLSKFKEECDTIKQLVSSIKLPVSDNSSNSDNFKVSWANQGGIPKVKFDFSSGKSQNAGMNPELILLDDSNDCTEVFVQNNKETEKQVPVIDLDEDQQLDYAMKLSMVKSEDGDDSDCCKVVFDNTPKKVARPRKVYEHTAAVVNGIDQKMAASICAKFFDSVKFNSAAINQSQEEHSSSSDDFEEVQDISHTDSLTSFTNPSRSQVTVEEKGKVDSPVVTINLTKESLSLPPEHDIFSDIFEKSAGGNTSTLNNQEDSSNEPATTTVEKELEMETSEQVTNEVDQQFMDSDSDSTFTEVKENETTEELSVLGNDKEDQGTENDKEDHGTENDKEDQGTENDKEDQGTENDKEDRGTENDKEDQGTENENSTTELIPEPPKPSSSNQKIARTLGTMPSVKMITADYMQAQQKLNTEQSKLQQAKGFQERVATSITDQMYIEAQELLALFGIPYVISPMEAESQCAFLDTACLTDGTLTDDSDVWLFGGRRVYKNFFSQGDKHVEFFQYADIVRVLSLDREKLVLLAMLTGSDYTEGIEGVGPVTALEIISEFPSTSETPLEPLIKFREWWDVIQHASITDAVGNKVREKFRKLKLRPGFPNKAVYDAYLDPTIDNSTESFKWGSPDLDALRTFTKMKFGWDQSKCDSTLLPVLKNLRCQAIEIDRQMTMDKFLIFGEKEGTTKRKLKSQRLARAVKKIKRAAPSGELKLSSSESETSDDDLSSKKSPKKLGKKSVKKTPEKSVSQTTSSSDAPPQGTSNPSVSAVKKSMPILQKVQDETNKTMNKLKAIEIFKSKKLPDT